MLKEILKRWLKQAAPNVSPKTDAPQRVLPAFQSGLGLSGPNVIIKRKFRWLMEAELPYGQMAPTVVRVNNRPSFTVETGIFGEQVATHGTITTSFEHFEGSTPDPLTPLYTYFQQCYDFSSTALAARPPSPRITLNLTLVDHDGFGLESWKMLNAFPVSINFGELDYSSSDLVTVEVEWRYNKVEYTCLSKPLDFNRFEPHRNLE
jgi:hypothetical protein